MSTERKKILEMLAEGKITADEADRLLSALESNAASREEVGVTPGETGNKKPKYLCVNVKSKPGSNRKHENVDIKIPIMLLKAGVKLGALVPDHTKSKFASHLQEKGIGFDMNNMDAEKLEQLIEALTETSIDVDADDETVRICCR